MISVCFEVFSCRITKERKYGAIIFRGTSECVGADEAGRTAVTADSTETAERWRTNLEVQMRENVSTGSSFHRVILQTEPEIHPVSLFNSGSAPTLDICQLQRALPSEWEVLDPSVSGRFPRFRLKKSCCVLDNICIQRKEPNPVDQDVLPEDFDPCADFEIVELKIHVHFFFFSLTATIWVLAASSLWKCF